MPVFNVMVAVKAFGFVLGVCAACLVAGYVLSRFGDLLDYIGRSYGVVAKLAAFILAMALVAGVVAGFVVGIH